MRLICATIQSSFSSRMVDHDTVGEYADVLDERLTIR